MISSFVRALVSAFKARRELALENVALRQQLAVLRRSVKRPRLSLRVLPPLSVGEMTLRLYAALNYSQNSARISTDSPRARADSIACAFYLFIRGCLLRLLLPWAPQ